MKTARSTCPFDCPDACGLLVDVEGGRAVAVRGDPEHPYSRGSLCPKMTHYERSVHSPLRLTTPLLRQGKKGEGRFAPTSWDEAIARIAERWKQLIASHGAQSILPYSYAGTMGMVQRFAGHAFFHRLGASRLDRTICQPAKDFGWKAVMGATPGPHPDRVLDSDLVVLWGINAVATNLHFAQRVQRARKAGAKVLLLDTYRNDTAAIADEVLQVAPGSDGALALALMHVLARENLADEAFLAANAIGWADLKERVLAQDSPAWAERIVGMPAAGIEQLARALAGARAPFLRLGGGLTRYGNGAMNVRCIVALSAALGAFGRKGGGCFCSASGAPAFDLSLVTREDLQPGPTRLVNMNQLGRALTELDSPRVMSLFVYASNPAAVAPDQNAVLRGLEREDLFTVVHERFLTDTARYADVVLPAPSSLETSDLFRSYGQYCAQRVRPAIERVGESRSNWETFQLLARAMGFSEPIFGQSEDQLIDELIAKPSPWREGVDAAALQAGRAVELRVPEQGWATPSGKIELRNDRHREPLPRYLANHADADLLPLRLMTAPALNTLNSTFQERDELRQRAKSMRLKLSAAEASRRGLLEGSKVLAFNALGEVPFELEITDAVPDGVAVAEGVWWIAHAPGKRTVNALVSQRLTDEGAGATFYDNRIDVRPA